MNFRIKNIIFFRRPYYKLLRLHRGISMGIYLTWKCNFNCSYCPVPVSDYFDPNEWTFGHWLNFLKTFPVKIKEVALSGGEPTLRPGIVEFVNKLLDAGYFVTIYSNLSRPDVLNEIRTSPRLIILTNYHNEFISKEKFLANVGKMKHQLQVGEFKKLTNISGKIRDVYLISESKRKAMMDIIYQNNLKITPKGRLVLSCYEAVVKYAKD